ncbi:MAG TPA: beta-propeller fold lactonase family protein [Albitalea sp.]|uniref:lactonase family protein n=1 Tax=Piscinibacter sp. TaxID=1903157 RepID=UPI002ED3AA71
MSAFRLLRTLLASVLVLLNTAMSHAATVVYVSNADSKEISVLLLDAERGDLALVQTLPVGGQVMPMAVSPDRKFLYAALRSQPYTVASFRIDAADGRLTPIGTSPLPDSMASIGVDRIGRTLFAASYGGHKLSVSPIGRDGVVGPTTQVLPTGQNAHAVLTDPSNHYLFVTNLGSDAVMQLRFDAATGQVSPNTPPTFAGRAKAGPRHLVFHPDGRHVYLLNELDATVDVLAFDAQTGTLSPVQTLSTLPAGFTGKPWAADLHVTPDGRFLYTSERTTSTLAAFAVDASKGTLKLLSHTPTEKQPRGFNIDPSGRYLVAVGQLSHAVTLYAIDRDSGGLKPLKSYSLGQNPNWVEIVSLP